MARYLIAAAALGGVSAVLYLSVLATPAGLILSGFAQAPLFVAGLTLGLAGAIAASAAAALLATMALGLAGGLAYALVHTLPVLILVQRALLSRRAGDGGVEWYTAGLLTTWLTGLGLLALAALLLIYGAGDGGIGDAVMRSFEAVLPAFGPNQEAVRQQFEVVAPILPGVAVASWLALTAVNGALGQAIASRSGRALRPAPDIAETELPHLLAGALAVAAALAYWTSGALGVVAANAAVLLSLPFLILGLAVIHAAAKGIRGRRLLLTAVYTMIALVGLPALAIIGLGLIEQGFGLKRRFAAPRPGGA
jgi:hypothetical protein